MRFLPLFIQNIWLNHQYNKMVRFYNDMAKVGIQIIVLEHRELTFFFTDSEEPWNMNELVHDSPAKKFLLKNFGRYM